jgi:anti-anti-sigma regulatory factor
MTTKAQPLPVGALAISRIGPSAWILRVVESLETRAVPALRETFRTALENDAHDVVVDLPTAAAVSPEAAAALAEMAETMSARGGALWIAAPRPGGDGYTLRPVQRAAPDGLVGVSRALDVALVGAAA